MKNEVFHPEILDVDVENAKSREILQENDFQTPENNAMDSESNFTFEHSAMSREFVTTFSACLQASISL